MDSYHPAAFALTGGTGALGLAFLQSIFQRNPKIEVRLLLRRSSASFQSDAFQEWLRQNERRATLIDGDLRHLSSKELEPLLQTDGGIWHFAALTSLSVGSEDVAQEIHEVNVEGTARLLKACLQSQARGPFYHISTAYVVGERQGRIYETESIMSQAFRNPYEAAKLQAELRVQQAFAEGMTGAIFRPSVVVDDRSGTGGFKMVDACAYAVALAVKRGEPFVFRMPDRAAINLVHSDWVIAAMIDLARLPSGSGRTYHLTTPRQTSFHEIVAILEEVVPGLKLSFEPDLKRSDLPSASRIFDKAVADIRPYFEADVDFDRTHTERDLAPDLKETPLDLAPFVRRRLQAELGQVTRRKQGPEQTDRE